MTLLKYEHIHVRDSGEPLVDLAEFNFVLEPVYFNRALSSDSRLFIRLSIAEKLNRIQKRLGKYRFKIWDGWRSREVQHRIYMKYWKDLEADHPDWEDQKLKKEVGTFITVANDPNRAPIHATGGSTDLTLIDLSGKELNMGTGFDHFGPESASLFYEKNDIDEQVKTNRKFLREIMAAEDFRSDDNEWWHFDYGNQLWAAFHGKSYAIYGECTLPGLL